MIGNNIKKQGATLIEVLTSVAIIGIISAIFITNYNQAGRQSNLQLATQLVITDIRFAQANALGLVEYSGASPQGGWGIYFNSQEPFNQEYRIFADINANKRYDSGEDEASLGGRVISLPSQIVIDSVGTSTDLSIVFIPPDPLTFINSQTDPIHIVLRDLNNNSTSTIFVNFAGLIEEIYE